MKNLIVVFLLTLFSTGVMGGNIILEGRYQQRNIFVINSVSGDGAGFCVYEVTVNGQVSTDEVNSQAFEIDLSIYNLKVGDPVSIIIKHKDGCLPKVLNPGALEPAPTFICTKIDCTEQGLLSWETKDELGKLPFIVQQFKWNKWVNVGEVMGNGNVAKNTYKLQITLTSGLNKLRVVQKSYEGDLRKSQTAEINSQVAPVVFKYDRKSKKINFSADTAYELYNAYGQIVKRGHANNVDVTSLNKGDYYLSYDNKTDKFLKK